MSNTIILNSTHKREAHRYEYIFPSSVKFGANDQIALQSISMYNSIFNVEAQRGNNTVSVIWNANTTVQHNFTIPDGYYSVSDLNYFLQQKMILNKLYVTDANGDNYYFVELLVNENQYGVQVNTYALPTSAQATTLGYVKPSGASWDWPTTASTAQFIVPTAAFGNLIGFEPATYPSGIETTDQQFLSTKTPQISPVNSILLGCNLIASPYSNPIHLFYSIPITVSFGSLINHANTSPIYNKIAAGTYSKIIIDFYSQDYNSLRLHDDEIVIVLSVVKRD